MSGDFNDANDANQEAAGYLQLTTRNGMRCSAATAFVRPAMDRPKLHVETNVMVEKLEFEGSRAVGVCYSSGVKTYTAHRNLSVVARAAVTAVDTDRCPVSDRPRL